MKKEKSKYHSIRKPNIVGGKKGFREFLAQQLVYPAEALEKKVEGIVHVKCEISDRGKVLSAHSMNKLGHGLDEEAERLCLLLQFEDTTERGLKIKHSRTVRIPFALPKQSNTTDQYNYQSTPAEKKEEPKKTSYTYTIKF